MGPVEPLGPNQWESGLPLGYDPRLNSVTGYQYGARPDNARLNSSGMVTTLRHGGWNRGLGTSWSFIQFAIESLKSTVNPANQMARFAVVLTNQMARFSVVLANQMARF